MRALEADGRLRLRDVARSASRGDAPVQAALVASDLDDLRAKLALVEAGSAGEGVYLRTEPADEPGRLAFLFPGQGSQRVGMLRDLFVAFPHLRGYLELGRPWTDCVFPPSARSAEERDAQRAALTDTRVAQPALGVAGLAAARLLERLGVRPDAAAGHSYGELVALAVAGALREDDLLVLSRARGERILAAAAAAAGGDPGAMAAVSGGRGRRGGGRGRDRRRGRRQRERARPGRRLRADGRGRGRRSPALADEGLRARRIPVACAFHSPLVAAAAETFADDLGAVAVEAPAFPVYANTTAAPHADDPEAIRALLAEHVRSPVRFAAEVEAMYADGARVFVETGPGRVLTNLVGRILRGRPHVAVRARRPGPRRDRAAPARARRARRPRRGRSTPRRSTPAATPSSSTSPRRRRPCPPRPGG